MGKKSTPKAPDYTAAAEATAASSQQATNRQTYANRPTQTTPWGTDSWTQGTAIDPSTGQNVTTWNENQTLTPELQSALNDQLAIQAGRSAGAQDLLGQAVDNFQTPVDWGKFNPVTAAQNRSGNLQTSLGPAGNIQTSLGAGNYNDAMKQASDSVMGTLKPQLDQSREDMMTRLANQGITQGSEAYNREMNRLDNSDHQAELQAYSAAQAAQAQGYNQDLSTATFGNQAQAQGFNQDLSSAQFGNTAQQNAQSMDQSSMASGQTYRQQQIAEAEQQRTNTLNELNALLTGQQVQSPQMPGFTQATVSQPVDYTGAAQAQYNGALNSAAGSANSAASTMSGIGSLAGMAAMFM